MGRRFRLIDPRTNEGRMKKTGPSVSFPRALLLVNMPHGILLSSPLPTPSEQIHMTPSLLISLPVSSFLSGLVLSVVQLGMRLSKIQLPPAWVLTSSSPLVLCNVMSQSTHAATCIAMRFTLATAWMEMYKKQEKKLTQKSKGLRQQLV